MRNLPVVQDLPVSATYFSSRNRWAISGTSRQGGFVHVVALLILAGSLLFPSPGQGKEPQADSISVPPDEIVSTAGSAEERLSLLDEKYASLKKEYSKRNDALNAALGQLTDVMKRLEECRDWRDEKKKMLDDDKNLRGLLSATGGELQSLKMLRQQGEKEFSSLKVQSEEHAALLSVATEELQTCNADKSALSQVLNGREAETTALRTKLELQESKLSSLVSLENDFKTQRTTLSAREEEIAGLKKDLSASREKIAALAPLEKQVREKQDALSALEKQVKEKQDAVSTLEGQVKKKQDAVSAREEEIAGLKKEFAAVRQSLLSLQQEQEKQAEIKVKLVKKVQESVSLLMELQSKNNRRGE